MIRSSHTHCQRASRSASTEADACETLGPDAWRAIRQRARRIVGKAGLTPSDRDDIEQELALRLWQGLADYSPAKGHAHGFIATVLDRAAASLLRSRRSRRRGGDVVHQQLPANGHGGSTAEEEPIEPASAAGSHEDAVDLAHDVATILGQLPPEVRELAEQLKTHNITEIARRRGISRSTVYAHIGELRTRFEASGLGKNR